MSIGSLGVIGSLTSGQLQQTRGADSDRATQDAQARSSEASSARKAEAAEGIGQMLQDEGASDRDGDGRRMWERAAQKAPGDETPESISSNAPHSLDPTGQAGGNLDLTG